MIYELQELEYGRLKPLLERMTEKEGLVAIKSVIEGTNRGKIYVDNLEQPRTALVFVIMNGFYFIGDSDNDGFNSKIEEYVLKEVAEFSLSLGGTYFVYNFKPEKMWESNAEKWFKHKNPEKNHRWNFNFNEEKYRKLGEWKSKIPEGYYAKKIDRELLENKVAETFMEEITDFWPTLDKFLEKGLGFCVMHGDKVVSACISALVSENICNIVINTYDKNERKNGFATMAARAFIDYCLENNCIPYWDAYEENIASVTTAERLGFEKNERYAEYNFPFNEE